MSYLCIMTFWLCLVEANKLCKKHVYNSIMPSHEPDSGYNISVWVKQLHLQQCVIVEIGDKFCAVFVEYRPADTQVNAETEEYFLGLCDLDTLRKWKLCPTAVANERPSECIFNEYTELSNSPTRVHRRLCDVTGLAINAELCNCSSTIFSGRELYAVSGFPTCFLHQLPESLCQFGNVCGISSCKTRTINEIHTVKCNTQCFDHQPFCESTGSKTTRASEIYSYWSDWREPLFSNDSPNPGFVQTEAVCINKNTFSGLGAVDCLGPGTNCCPANADECRCNIYLEDGILKLSREMRLKHSYNQKKRRSIYFDTNVSSKMSKHKDSSRAFVTRVDNYREKYSNKDNKMNEDDYEDDDDGDADDQNSEDIMLEEEEDEVDEKISTTEQSERSELRVKANITKPESADTAVFAVENGENQTKKSKAEENQISNKSALTSNINLRSELIIFFTIIYLCN